MFKFTAIVMRYAPIGIGAAIAVTVGHSGLGVLINLGKLILTLYGALLVFVLVRLHCPRFGESQKRSSWLDVKVLQKLCPSSRHSCCGIRPTA